MDSHSLSRYQRWCSRLTKRKVKFLLSWEMWKFFALTGFLLFGVISLGLSIWALLHGENSAQLMLFGAIWTAMTLLAFYALPQQRLDSLRRSHFFDLCGDTDTLHEQLQSGAADILLETDTLVMTKDYLIRRGDPSAYVPYAAISAFFFGYGGGNSADLAVSAKGRHTVIPIRRHDRSRKDEMQRILEQQAPQAASGNKAWIQAYFKHR